VQRLVQDPLAMRILDGSVLPGELVRVDVDPNSDSMRFEQVEQKEQQAPAAEAEEPETVVKAAKSGRRK
jgi:ATP-dependent Clp protease ATP-binding subunit ClpB